MGGGTVNARPTTKMSQPWVYPRVGGGTQPPSSPWSSASSGLSPRGRGNRLKCRIVLAPVEAVYPRVGGGTAV